MMCLLGMGSSTSPLRPDTWTAWRRLNFEYDGVCYIGSFAPLFIHQYSQAWFDFRNKRDQFADYFQNSTAATEAHRLFCIDLRKQFPDYGKDLWGITASDSPKGYVVWGGPPATGASEQARTISLAPVSYQLRLPVGFSFLSLGICFAGRLPPHLSQLVRKSTYIDILHKSTLFLQ